MSFFSGLTSAVTGAATSVSNAASSATTSLTNTLRRAASTNSKKYENAPAGEQVTTTSGVTYTKPNNGHTGTFGPSTKGGRRKNCWTRKNKNRKNKSRKNNSRR